MGIEVNKIMNIGQTNYDRYDPVIYENQQAELKKSLLKSKSNAGDLDKMNTTFNDKFQKNVTDYNPI